MTRKGYGKVTERLRDSDFSDFDSQVRYQPTPKITTLTIRHLSPWLLLRISVQKYLI